MEKQRNRQAQTPMCVLNYRRLQSRLLKLCEEVFGLRKNLWIHPFAWWRTQRRRGNIIGPAHWVFLTWNCHKSNTLSVAYYKPIRHVICAGALGWVNRSNQSIELYH